MRPTIPLGAAALALLAACSAPADADRGAAPEADALADPPPAPHVVLATSGGPPPAETPRARATSAASGDEDEGLERVALLALIERLGVEREPVPVEALDGTTLGPMPATAAVRVERAEARERAAQAWLAAPDDEQAAAWFGRRLAYEGRYHDAVVAYTAGLQRFPRSERLHRHRGHRFITLRRFERAEADLRRAAALMRGVPDEPEPDGQPNAEDVPRSTRHGNVLYHLGLSLYLQGRFREAAARWVAGLECARNDDAVVSMAWWAWLASRRAGMSEAHCAPILARVQEDMQLLENHDYHALLMLAKGQREVDALLPESPLDSISDSTRAYGVSAVLLLRGEEQRAREVWQRIVQGPWWAAFGHIAAEAALARAG